MVQTDLQLTLQVTELPVGLGGLAVSMSELDFHLVQISIHLLLQAHGFIPAPGLRVQSALEHVNGPLIVSLEQVNLFVFLRHLPVQFRLHLVELQLDMEDLGFLMF